MNIQEKNRYLHAILSNMATAVVVVDSNHHIHYMNEQAERYFGSKRELKCYEAFLGHKKPCEKCFVERSLINKVERLESQREGRGGKVFDILSTVIEDKEGNPLLIELFNDVTEKVRLEKEQKRLVAIVNKKRVEVARELVATLKHKINNSLTGLLAVIDYLDQSDKERELIEGDDPYYLMKEEIGKIRHVLSRLSHLKVLTTKEYIKGEMMVDLDIQVDSFNALSKNDVMDG